MKKIAASFLVLSSILLALQATGKEARLTDSEIAKTLISESIASYSGNCPCPYNSASNGSRCGKRSAYNRAGGYAPLCFKEDITPEMIKDYRGQHEE